MRIPSRNIVLLDRTSFREGVFARDGFACVNCKSTDVKMDAHHIIERRLFSDGGYYLDNGATVCEPCHLLAEQTILSCDDLRVLAGIDRVVLPDHLYRDHEYDKWGNLLRPNGRRLRGELFYDESVQKVLGSGGVLSLFDDHVKYPRTLHLPWSPGRTKDDRVLENTDCFAGREVVVTLKMDGENTTIYRDGLHARSVDGDSHPSQSHVRALQGRIGYDLPAGWRVVLENLFAAHSIRYNDLEGFAYLISIWNERNEALSWDDTIEYAQLLDVPVVRSIYRGIFDEALVKKAFDRYAGTNEGYVVRVADKFEYRAFRKSVAKFVRENHVQETVHNWRTGWYESDSTVNGLS